MRIRNDLNGSETCKKKFWFLPTLIVTVSIPRYESNMEVTDSTKTIVGVTFGYLYDQMYDDARRNSLVEAVGKFTQDMLMDPGIESKVSEIFHFGPH